MGACHNDPSHGKSDLVISVYYPTPTAQMLPRIPLTLPCSQSGCDCLVRSHSIRDRKTGPDHPLLVVVCRTHERYFTIYPPGFAPYLRASLHIPTPVRPRPGLDRAALTRSCFAAAVLAALGIRWPRQARGGPCWRTRRRHIARAARLLGLDSGDLDESLVSALRVGLTAHAQARRRARGGWQQTAVAVVDLLEAVAAGDAPLVAVLRAGRQVGLWGRVFLVSERFVLQLIVR